MRLKVAHINGAYGRGGAALFMRDISQKISELDCNVLQEFIVGRNYGAENNKVHSLLNKFEFLTNVMFTRVTGRDCFGLPFTKRSYFLSNLVNFNIIHLHNLHGYYFNINDVDLLLNKPVVWTIHDFWINTARVGFYEEDKFDYKTGKYSCLSEHPRSFFLNPGSSISRKKREIVRLLSNTVKFVAVSEYAKNEIKRVFPEIQIEVIYNGVDTEIYNIKSQEKYRPTNCFNIVLLASNFRDKRKGIVNFFETLCFLKDLHIKPQLNIDFLGELEIPHKYKYLTKLFKIKLHGFIEDKHAIAHILSQADLFINLSINESFCLSNVEAMACGIPLLLYDNKINREVVGDVGVYIKTRTPNEIGSCLVNIINKQILLPDPMILRKRSLCYDIYSSANAYLKLYKNMISGTK